MSTVLITGMGGFVGSHLVDFLLQDRTTKIVGILHPDHPVQHLEENPEVTVYRQDLMVPKAAQMLLQEIHPEVIYHLAGFSHIHESWKYRIETIETNFLGTLHLLEACRALKKFPKVLLVGSGECYGIVPEAEQPISESRALVPSSPYAVSKIAQEILGIEYARAEGLPVYLSRSFNHTGPRQKETFVCSAFARQIAVAELDPDRPEIRVGNVVARRDFSDVRDVVRAYHAILEKGTPGQPYNVCSGRAISIQEVLNILQSYTKRELRVSTDPEKFRPADMPLLLGSAASLKRDTGWDFLYNIHTTLLDLLEYWRAKVKAGKV